MGGRQTSDVTLMNDLVFHDHPSENATPNLTTRVVPFQQHMKSSEYPVLDISPDWQVSGHTQVSATSTFAVKASELSIPAAPMPV